MLIGFLLTSKFVNEAYNKSLLKDTYQVQSYSDNTSEYYPSLKARESILQLNKTNNHSLKSFDESEMQSGLIDNDP